MTSVIGVKDLCPVNLLLEPPSDTSFEEALKSADEQEGSNRSMGLDVAALPEDGLSLEDILKQLNENEVISGSHQVEGGEAASDSPLQEVAVETNAASARRSASLNDFVLIEPEDVSANVKRFDAQQPVSSEDLVQPIQPSDATSPEQSNAPSPDVSTVPEASASLLNANEEIQPACKEQEFHASLQASPVSLQESPATSRPKKALAKRASNKVSSFKAKLLTKQQPPSQTRETSKRRGRNILEKREEKVAILSPELAQEPLASAEPVEPPDLGNPNPLGHGMKTSDSYSEDDNQYDDANYFESS